MPNSPLRDKLAVLVALIILAVLAAVILLKGASLKEFSDFIVLLVPAMLGGMWLTNQKQSAKSDEINKGVDTIKRRVNGELDAKFNSIHERLDAADVPRVSPAAHPAFDVDMDADMAADYSREKL